ncbi:MAG: tRNA pseudouridine(38-40) synthase TruA [Bacteroidales bacterium]|nr:tRNA pseudouridine(38-40) synthase TruA [Bacteroidales bacterium]
MRYKITLSYNGLTLSGWQRQNNAASVQGELSKALSTLLGREVEITGAGRTDARVSAVRYVAHFDGPEPVVFDAAATAYKLNAILPKCIVIHEITPESETFHARFSATSREYHYFVHRKKDPFISEFSYFYPYHLDLEAMNRAAKALPGEHDFSCFEKAGSDNRTSVCTVSEAVWEPYRPTHVSMLGYPYEEGDYLVFRIRANRFLRNMVRAIVGSLIEVGRGKRDEAWIASLIESGTRCDAGESVPGHALFLSDITYSKN